jgi:hypothetical protein
VISAHRRWFNVLIEQHGRGVAARRFLVILCLMFVGADLCSAQSTSMSSGRSTAVVVRWTALGVGAGFGLGAYLGVAFFDDAVNSDGKLWTSAIVGGVAGGIGGYLIGRHRDRNRPSAAAPAHVVALPTGIPIALVPTVAAAQPPTTSSGRARVTVGVGVFAESDDTWGAPGPPRGGGLSGLVAIDVWRRVRARMELNVPAMSTTERTFDLATSRLVETRLQRMITLSPLIEVLGPRSDRVGVSVLAGMAGSWRQSRAFLETRPPNSGIGDHLQTGFGDSRAGFLGNFIFGGEVAVSLTRHLVVAPGVRLLWLPFNDFGSTIVRPGLQLQWHL